MLMRNLARVQLLQNLSASDTEIFVEGECNQGVGR